MISITHQNKSPKNSLLLNHKKMYRKTNIEPNKFRSQIKFTNSTIRIKKSTSHKILNINERINHNALYNSIRIQPK